MINFLNKITKDIETKKEIISTLPVNTKKNRAIYIEKLKEIKNSYEKLEGQVFQRIKEEYENEIQKNALDDDTLEQKKIQIEKIEKIETAIDKIKAPYEKMKLDKAIYNLKRFYRKNIETINEEIKKCIDAFKQVGINLTSKDFNFTPYVSEYMQMFFEQLEKNKFDTKTMKEEFEKIYWKSPNIITHIQLNIRYIFLKKESFIEQLYKEQEKIVKRTLKISTEEIEERYNDLKIIYIEENKKQRKTIINKFLDGYWNLKDYEEKSMNKTYAKFINLEKLNENREEIDRHLIKLLHNLYEYQNYLRFKYLFDEVRTIYQEEKGKESYKAIKKQIIDKGNSLVVTNKIIKISQKEKEKILQDMEVLCEQLDVLEVKEKIRLLLNEKSTLKEMSNVIASFYKFLFTCIIKNNKDITEQEILVEIEEFEEFAKYPYNTISESIIMIQDKDIPLMIKDRYNLFDIKITKDSLQQNNIENLIVELQKIENNYYIKSSGLQINNIDTLCKMKKIIA